MGKNDRDYECRVASSSALGTKQRVRQQQHLIRFQITTFNTTTMGTNSTVQCCCCCIRLARDAT